MSWKTKEGKWRKPKEVNPPPTITETIKNREFWKNRTMTYLKTKKYFDQDVRTGVCYFCKKEGKPQYSKPTYLHHLHYEHSDPLAWTIEVCGKCHYKIDDYNKKILRRRFAPRDFAKSVDREAERIAFNNMSHEEMLRKCVRGYTEFKLRSENS